MVTRNGVLVGLGLWMVFDFASGSNYNVADTAQLSLKSPFVIICTQRTGSAWITKTLRNRTCDVDAEYEILSDTTWCLDRTNPNHSEKSSCTRDLALQREALEELYDPTIPMNRKLQAGKYDKWHGIFERSRKYKTPKAYGFKWMTNQGMDESWKWFLKLAKARRLKLLFLHRRDYLRMAISRRHISDKTLNPHPSTIEDAEKIRNTKIQLPTGKKLIEELDITKEKFQTMDSYRSQAMAEGLDTLKITYEDVSEDPFKMFTKTWKFLTKSLNMSKSKCNASALGPLHESESIEIHNAPASTYVKNWKDVKKTLMDSSYSRFAKSGERRR